MTTTAKNVLAEIDTLRGHIAVLERIRHSLSTCTSVDGRREVSIGGFTTRIPTDKLQRLISDQTAETVMRLHTLEKHMETIDKLLNEKMRVAQ